MTNENEEPDKPINDAMEHLHKIEGIPVDKGGWLPQPIKLIGYFMFGGIILILLFGIFSSFFFN
ncbi:hypothetical protein [Virgibacillus doumboii]|uniref:hypothetical protein n=1 Tax=Virgibacillus doumboii TaxID=2697503 RepID=UPI0013E009E1|nr:hypothetical protein [Virgibacillus doumboii]